MNMFKLTVRNCYTVNAINNTILRYRYRIYFEGGVKTSSGKDKEMTRRAIGIYLARAEELKNIKLDRDLPIAPTHDIGHYTNPKDIPYMPIAPRARRKKTEVDCTKLSWSKKWCDDRSECRWNSYTNKCEFFI